jgi:MFS transporter, ACS family, aldohexuronate transporter
LEFKLTGSLKTGLGYELDLKYHFILGYSVQQEFSEHLQLEKEVLMALARYRWLILLIAWMSYLTVYIARLGVGPMAPFIKKGLGLTNTQVGSLVSATAIVYAPTLIVGGWMVDRIGVRPVLVFGILISGICSAAVFLAPSYTTIFIILLLSGLGAGCILPSAVKAIVMWFPPGERATALGINQTAINFAGIIGAIVLPTVAVILGWRYGFLFIGFGALVICFCCGVIYRNPQPQSNLPIPNRVPDSIPGLSTSRMITGLLGLRDFRMIVLAAFLLGVVEFATMANLVLYLTEGLAYGSVAAGGLLAMTEFAGALGKPVTGFVSDRLLSNRRIIPLGAMAAIAGVMCFVLATGWCRHGWVLHPALAVLGLTSIGWSGLYVASISELTRREAAGTAVGLGTSIAVLSVIVGPPFFGYVVDVTGSFRVAWLVMALTCLASAVSLFMIRGYEKRR